MFCFDKSFVFSTFGPLFIFPPTPGLAKLPLKKKTWLRLNSKACRGRQRFNWGFIWTTLNVAQCNTRTCTPTVFAFLPSGLFEDLQCWKLLSSCLDECLLICVECVCAQQSGVMSALSTHVWMLFFLPFFSCKGSTPFEWRTVRVLTCNCVLSQPFANCPLRRNPGWTQLNIYELNYMLSVCM